MFDCYSGHVIYFDHLVEQVLPRVIRQILEFYFIKFKGTEGSVFILEGFDVVTHVLVVEKVVGFDGR